MIEPLYTRCPFKAIFQDSVTLQYDEGKGIHTLYSPDTETVYEIVPLISRSLSETDTANKHLKGCWYKYILKHPLDPSASL